MLEDLKPQDETTNAVLNWTLTEIVNPILGLAAILSIIYFVAIVIQFFAAYKSGEDLSKLKAKLIWGLIGVILVTSSWTIVNILYTARFK